MKKNHLLLFCLTGLSFFLFVTDSPAVMRKVTLSDLISRARHICYGQVADLTSEWNESMTAISTTVRLSVFENLKGKAPASLSFTVAGGVVGEIGQRNSNSPLFWPNERVIVFIDSQSRLVEEFQGKFQVYEGLVRERGLLLKAFFDEIRNVQSALMEGNFFPRPAEQAGNNSSFCDYSISGYRWCEENPMGENFYFNTRITENQRSACMSAALTWNNSGACFQFSYGGITQVTGTSYDGTSVIYWGSQLSEQTLAQTTYWYTASTGCLLEVDCGFNAQLAWSTTGDGSAYDIETCMLHEFGHYLSLNHSQNPEAVMYPYYSGIKRSLSDDDKAGIIRLYGTCGVGEEPAWDSTYQLSIGSPESLALLRNYRDQVLRRNPSGSLEVRRLYSQSSELLRVLASNPKLILQAHHLIEENLPEIQKAVNHQDAVLQDQEGISAFMDSLASSGSRRTRAWLGGLKRDMVRCQRTGRKFHGFRIER
ncbi:MAG: matrixin family metalloprotease [bacterium]